MSFKRLTIVFVSMLALSSCKTTATSQSPDEEVRKDEAPSSVMLERSTQDELDAFVAVAMEEVMVPGLQVAVVDHGEVVFSRAYGVVESGRDRAMTQDTRMMIGSTTKPMTSMLVASLVDKGVLGWDTPLKEVFPQFKTPSEELTQGLTMEQSLCACSGIPRADLELLLGPREPDIQALLTTISTLEPVARPGEAYNYQNQLIALAGYAAGARAYPTESSVHTAYVKAMQEYIFNPLGMSRSTFDHEQALSDPNHASPHAVVSASRVETFPIKLEQFTVPVAPSGGAWSTAEDMAQLMVLEMNRGKVSPGGEALVSEASLTHRWSHQIQKGKDTWYGLGWGVVKREGLEVLTHTGSTLGFTSFVAIYPEHHRAVVVTTNSGTGVLAARAIETRIFEMMFAGSPYMKAKKQSAAEFLEQSLVGLKGQVAQLDTLTQPPSEEWIGKWSGTYHYPNVGSFELVMRDGALLFDFQGYQAPVVALPRAEGKPQVLLLKGAPLMGLLLMSVEQDGVQHMIFSSGQEKLVFVRQ